MKKQLCLIATLLLFVKSGHAGLVTHVDYVSGNTITAAAQNTNENTIYTEFNGNIENSNIKSAAGINLSKLSLSDNASFTGTLTLSSATITHQIGTTTNDDATSTTVGESTESVVTSISAGSSTQWSTIASVLLTPGDWNVTGVVQVGNVASVTAFDVGLGTVTNSSAGMVSGSSRLETLPPSATVGQALVIPNLRASLSANTTYYLESNITFSGSTPTQSARISARRVR